MIKTINSKTHTNGIYDAEGTFPSIHADVVLAIFEPYRYLPEDTLRDLLGYELMKLRDSRGFKFYRSIHILKI